VQCKRRFVPKDIVLEQHLWLITVSVYEIYGQRIAVLLQQGFTTDTKELTNILSAIYFRQLFVSVQA
jgi:hypothetical protein